MLQALHLHPHDKAIVYNIAMIEQKSAELLVSLPAAKRHLKDLELATQRAQHAQRFVCRLITYLCPSDIHL